MYRAQGEHCRTAALLRCRTPALPHCGGLEPLVVCVQFVVPRERQVRQKEMKKKWLDKLTKPDHSDSEYDGPDEDEIRIARHRPRYHLISVPRQQRAPQHSMQDVLDAVAFLAKAAEGDAHLRLDAMRWLFYSLQLDLAAVEVGCSRVRKRHALSLQTEPCCYSRRTMSSGAVACPKQTLRRSVPTSCLLHSKPWGSSSSWPT